MQAKWDSAVSEECPWCHSQRDTRYHQLFECTAFSDVREPFQHVLDHYQDWDPMIAELQQLVNNSERGKLEFYTCYSGCPPPKSSIDASAVQVIHTAWMQGSNFLH